MGKTKIRNCFFNIPLMMFKMAESVSNCNCWRQSCFNSVLFISCVRPSNKKQTKRKEITSEKLKINQTLEMTFDTRPFPMFSSSYYYRRYCQGLMYTNTYSPTPYSIAFHRKNGTFSSSSNEKLRSGVHLYVRTAYRSSSKITHK